MSKSISAVLLVLLIAGCAAVVRADTFLLSTGGEVEGTLLNANEVPRITYKIRTAAGGELTLNREQVKEVRRPKPGEQDYVKLRPQYPDTVEGQMKLADWCKARQLSDLRKRHLERVIELDPDHDKARAELGYAKVEGQWKTQDERFQERGYVKDASGKYRVPQQIDELKRKREEKEEEAAWFKKLKLWRSWLESDRSEEAVAQLQKITEPTAVSALAKRFADEPVGGVRKMYVEALARIATPDAWRALTIFSLDDVDDEIRQTCLDYLEKQPNTGAVSIYIKRMKDKGSDNVMVNRAASALQRMKDPSAVRPLIDSLMTTHVFQLPAAGGGALNPTFGSGAGGGGISFGGNQPKQEARVLQNPSVHDALVALTGTDFGYDQVLWRRWLATQRKTQPQVDARRD